MTRLKCGKSRQKERSILRLSMYNNILQRGSRVKDRPTPLPLVLALLNRHIIYVKTMSLDSYIQSCLDYERKLLTGNSSSSFENDMLQVWTSTIENAPRSIEAIQTLMDTKEVEMNKVCDVLELRQLDREWSALEWLQRILREVKNEQKEVKS